MNNFFTQHWALIIGGILILIGVIVLIVFTQFQVNPVTFLDQLSQKPCNILNNKGVINDMQIATGGKCSDNFNAIQVSNSDQNIYDSIYPKGSTVTNICTRKNNTLCEQDLIVTDAKILDMSDPKNPGSWLKSGKCDSLNDPGEAPQWFPAYPSSGVGRMSGELCDNLQAPFLCDSQHGCGKYGLCVRKDSYKNVKQAEGQYLSDAVIRVDECPQGYNKSENAIDGGCSSIESSDANYPPMKDGTMFLCTKYEKL